MTKKRRWGRHTKTKAMDRNKKLQKRELKKEKKKWEELKRERTPLNVLRRKKERTRKGKQGRGELCDFSSLSGAPAVIVAALGALSVPDKGIGQDLSFPGVIR